MQQATAELAAPASVADFLTVPETTLPNGLVVPAFRVGRYLASKSAAGLPQSTVDSEPWVSISYHAARQACANSGFALITETQWLSIAWNASQQDANWTGGAVGVGSLFQGLRNGNVSRAMPGSYQPKDHDERRWLQLSNGECICDFNGNAFQWVFDNVQGDESGLIAKAFAVDSPSLTTAPYPSMEKGMGWRPPAGRDWSGRALIRGGYWYSGSGAGAFDLAYGWPDYANDYVGFRCTNPGL